MLLLASVDLNTSPSERNHSPSGSALIPEVEMINLATNVRCVRDSVAQGASVPQIYLRPGSKSSSFF